MKQKYEKNTKEANHSSMVHYGGTRTCGDKDVEDLNVAKLIRRKHGSRLKNETEVNRSEAFDIELWKRTKCSGVRSFCVAL